MKDERPDKDEKVEKKLYKTPELTRLGSVKQLTQDFPGPGSDSITMSST